MGVPTSRPHLPQSPPKSPSSKSHHADRGSTHDSGGHRRSVHSRERLGICKERSRAYQRRVDGAEWGARQTRQSCADLLRSQAQPAGPAIVLLTEDHTQVLPPGACWDRSHFCIVLIARKWPFCWQSLFLPVLQWGCINASERLVFIISFSVLAAPYLQSKFYTLLLLIFSILHSLVQTADWWSRPNRFAGVLPV